MQEIDQGDYVHHLPTRTHWARRWPSRALGCLAANGLLVLSACNGGGVTRVEDSGQGQGPSEPAASTPAQPPTAEPGAVGVWLSASVDSSQIVTVNARVVFERPVYRFSVQTRSTELSDQIGDFQPRLRALEVSAPGQPPRTINGPGDKRDITFAVPLKSVDLTYEVDGVVQTAQPSSSGRMLVFVTGVQIPAAASLPRLISVDGALNLGCGAPAETVLSACGHAGDTGWTVLLRRANADQSVFAQVDSADTT